MKLRLTAGESVVTERCNDAAPCNSSFGTNMAC